MATLRRRKRILVGRMVLLSIGVVAYGAVKQTRKDADRIEQHTGISAEELSDEDPVAAMEELGIQSIELSDEDKAALAAEADQATVAGFPLSNLMIRSMYLVVWCFIAVFLYHTVHQFE